jgi:hypothetical protein
MSTRLSTPGIDTTGIWTFPAGLKWPHDKYHQEELDEKSRTIETLATEISNLKECNAKLKRSNYKLIAELKKTRTEKFKKNPELGPRDYIVSVRV